MSLKTAFLLILKSLGYELHSYLVYFSFLSFDSQTYLIKDNAWASPATLKRCLAYLMIYCHSLK